MQKLSLKQSNNLIIGTALAAEISSTSENLRAFISIGTYCYNENGRAAAVSKFLNGKDKKSIRFILRKYEIPKEYIENDWDVCDEELINSVFINTIKSIDKLESELSKYLDDFSKLDCAWKCDNPI